MPPRSHSRLTAKAQNKSKPRAPALPWSHPLRAHPDFPHRNSLFPSQTDFPHSKGLWGGPADVTTGPGEVPPTPSSVSRSLGQT